jgi:FK506-binding nuclear protein
MASIDPSSEPDNQEVDSTGPMRSTLKVIRGPMGDDDYEDLLGSDEEDEDDEEDDLDDDDEDEEEVNGGPSEKKQVKKAAPKAEDGDDDEDMDDAEDGDEDDSDDVEAEMQLAKLLAKVNKGKGKGKALDDDDEDSDEDDDDDMDEDDDKPVVVCTLDTTSVSIPPAISLYSTDLLPALPTNPRPNHQRQRRSLLHGHRHPRSPPHRQLRPP